MAPSNRPMMIVLAGSVLGLLLYFWALRGGPGGEPPIPDAPVPDAPAPEPADPPVPPPQDTAPDDREAPAAEPTHRGDASESAETDPPDASRADGATAPTTHEGDDDDATEPMPRTIWGVDAMGIRGAVMEARPQLLECFNGWLKEEPTLAGNLKLQFTIGDPEDGRTAEDGTELAGITDIAVFDSDIEHPWMEACAMNVFGELWFSPPEGGSTKVTYPLVFSRK